MFEGDEYRAYRTLCRQLRLERRRPDYGDWFGSWDPEESGRPFDDLRLSMCNDDGGGCAGAGPETEEAWLPRLDQWIPKLEEAGASQVVVSRAGGDRCYAMAEAADGDTVFWCTTCEEACARLWVDMMGIVTP